MKNTTSRLPRYGTRAALQLGLAGVIFVAFTYASAPFLQSNPPPEVWELLVYMVLIVVVGAGTGLLVARGQRNLGKYHWVKRRQS